MNINEKMNLRGMHNINNIMFVFAVCDIMSFDFDKAIETIKAFKPLEHRMEFVANVDGVEYYNDSIATIPEATINSVEALEKVDTLIVGGKDRGVKLEELIEYLKSSKVRNIICLPKTGEYIYDKFQTSEDKKVFLVRELQEAVEIAKEVTQKKMICLLSPAASSYGYFKNFKERGELFKKFVKPM